jgi:hypothetical protein
MTVLTEKYPTIFDVKKVVSSYFEREFELYLVTGVVNELQLPWVEKSIKILSEVPIEPNKIIISTLVNKDQLDKLYNDFLPSSKKDRGQYYPLANAIFEAYEKRS